MSFLDDAIDQLEPEPGDPTPYGYITPDDMAEAFTDLYRAITSMLPAMANNGDVLVFDQAQNKWVAAVQGAGTPAPPPAFMLGNGIDGLDGWLYVTLLSPSPPFSGQSPAGWTQAGFVGRGGLPPVTTQGDVLTVGAAGAEWAPLQVPSWLPLLLSAPPLTWDAQTAYSPGDVVLAPGANPGQTWLWQAVSAVPAGAVPATSPLWTPLTLDQQDAGSLAFAMGDGTDGQDGHLYFTQAAVPPPFTGPSPAGWTDAGPVGAGLPTLGAPGEVLAVDATGTDVEWVPAGGVPSWVPLLLSSPPVTWDALTAYQAGDVVIAPGLNPGETWLWQANASSPAGTDPASSPIWDALTLDQVSKLTQGEADLLYDPLGAAATALTDAEAYTDAAVAGIPTPAGLLPAGGSADQVLVKVDATNFNTKWATPAPSGSGTDNEAPPGGTTGQHLAKKSNADRDVEWVDPGLTAVDADLLYDPLGSAATALTTAEGYTDQQIAAIPSELPPGGQDGEVLQIGGGIPEWTDNLQSVIHRTDSLETEVQALQGEGQWQDFTPFLAPSGFTSSAQVLRRARIGTVEHWHFEYTITAVTGPITLRGPVQRGGSPAQPLIAGQGWTQIGSNYYPAVVWIRDAGIYVKFQQAAGGPAVSASPTIPAAWTAGSFLVVDITVEP